LAVATLDLEGKSVEQPIGAIALSSVEEYNLKAGINTDLRFQSTDYWKSFPTPTLQ